jgi:hypothetical protein
MNHFILYKIEIILNSLFGRGTKVPPVTSSFNADYISEKIGYILRSPKKRIDCLVEN